MAQITLNGNNYVVSDASLSHGYLPRQSPAFRQSGVQQRWDDPTINRFVINEWSEFGLGNKYLSRERESERLAKAGHHSSHITYIKDADAETRFSSMLTLPLLAQATTHSENDSDHLVKMVNFGGELWGLFEEDYAGGAVKTLYTKKFGASGTAWTGGGEVGKSPASGDTDRGFRGYDMLVHAGKLFVLCTDEGATSSWENRIVMEQSSNGTSFSTAHGGSGWDTGFVPDAATRRNEVDAVTVADVLSGAGPDIFALGLSFGQYLMVAVWDDTNSEIHVSTSTDISAWTMRATIGSAYPPRSFVAFRDPFTSGAPIIPVLVTAENIYKIDIANSTFSALLPSGILGGTPFDGLRAIVGTDGALYLPVRTGDILRVDIPQQSVIDILNVGPHSKAHGVEGDGLIAARRGAVIDMLDLGSRWLAVSYARDNGNSATHSSILCMDYETLAWHSFHVAEGTGNRLGFSVEDDGTPRLFWTVPAAAADAVYLFNNPLVSASAGLTQQFAASGYVEFAEDDLGDPQTQSTVYQVRLRGDDIDATEKVEYHYGVDGGSYTATDLGDITSDNGSLSFASGSGVAAYTLSSRINLARDSTTTLTPKIREVEIHAENKLLGTRFWPLDIDIEKTARECPPTKVVNVPIHETIIANLEAVATSKTQVSFKFAEHIAAINARASETQPPSFALVQVGGSNGNLGYRTGSCSIYLEEGI